MPTPNQVRRRLHHTHLRHANRPRRRARRQGLRRPPLTLTLTLTLPLTLPLTLTRPSSTASNPDPIPDPNPTPTPDPSPNPNQAFVDRLFRIQPPIGADYSGEWLTDRLFRIQALDTVGGDLLLCNHDGCGAHQTSNATLSGTLRNRGSTSRPSVTRAALVGISDSGPPLLERFEVSDPDQLDYFFTDDDTVTAVFDRATDLGANEARRGRVEP